MFSIAIGKRAAKGAVAPGSDFSSPKASSKRTAAAFGSNRRQVAARHSTSRSLSRNPETLAHRAAWDAAPFHPGKSLNASVTNPQNNEPHGAPGAMSRFSLDPLLLS